MSKFFKKCPKTAFLTVFSKICLRRRKFGRNRGKTVLWESSKNQFGRPKKQGRQNSSQSDKVIKIYPSKYLQVFGKKKRGPIQHPSMMRGPIQHHSMINRGLRRNIHIKQFCNTSNLCDWSVE